jgi:AmmeMemoRadiSam system protein A
MTAPAESGDELVSLARRALEAWVNEGRPLRADEIGPLAEEPSRGVFVCLKREGSLRGCVGSIAPATDTLGEETARSAVQAAATDPRFPPVEAAELAGLTCQVDVLSPLEPVESEADLDPAVYGVLVTAGERRGLLLPNLEGVDDVQAQLSIARAKGGIRPDEPQELQRFTVTRYTESPEA